MQADLLIEDQGDGWWHCPSPLECFIIDRPTAVPDAGGDFWLVGTIPAIEWRGDLALEERWGPDHPINKPFGPTSLALVMAVSRYGTDFTDGGYSVAYPVDGEAQSVGEAQSLHRHGAKVRVVRPS
jgi:hypothetical protein